MEHVLFQGNRGLYAAELRLNEARKLVGEQGKLSLTDHHYEFNREALQKAQPDYIIGIEAWIEKDEQTRLKQIAPSLFLPWEEGWRRHAGTVLYDDLQLAPASHKDTICWTQAIEVQDLGTYEADHILLSARR